MIQSYKKQNLIVLLVLVFKLIIIFSFPLSGDEAYFVKWGESLSAGYYDHPPMVGWLIYFMSYLNDSYQFFRLFSFFTIIIVAFVIFKILELYIDKEKAFLVALIFLVSPINILISLFTNDVPLVLFGSLGTLFLLYSYEKPQVILYSLLAGIFLGFAFLSKYFAAFLMLGLLIFSFITYKKKAIKNVLIVSTVVILFILQNLYFNYNSCWNNILFNFFARTKESTFHISGILSYLSIIIYIITPWGFYYLYKSKDNIKNSTLIKLISSILLFIFTIFLIVSFKNKVGFHWFFLFVPYMFLLFSFIEIKSLKKLFKYNAIFTAIHIFILLALILFPKSYFENHKRYSDVILFTQPDKICESIQNYDEESLFTLGYSTGAILSYHCKKDIKMMFNVAKYGRLDDKLLDIRTLDKKDIKIFDKRDISIHVPQLNNLCQEVSLEKVVIENANFYLAQCKGFQYDEYKKIYLDKQKERFYTIPAWLPVGECYFNDRYYK